MYIPNEVTMNMRANHMNICKFARNTEDGYLLLKSRLQELLEMQRGQRCAAE